MFKKFIFPISLLSSAIIGAGMFSLPYIFSRIGLWTGFLYLAILTFLVTLVHLLYGDIILRTPGRHDFVGYARIYLGNFASRLAVVMSVVEAFVLLAIYLILSVSFINLLIGERMNDFFEVFAFWFFGSMVLFWNLKKIAWVDLLINFGIALAAVISFIFVLKNFPIIDLSNRFSLNLNYVFLPIGPILFSLYGRVGAMEIFKYFHPERPAREIKKAIIWGTVIPAIIYGFFIITVLVVSGQVSEDAISGLAGRLPIFFLLGIGLFGVLELWSSYVAVGVNVKNILETDLRYSRRFSGFLIVLLPLFLYLINFGNFIFLVSLTGGVFLALEGIFIVLMWLATNRRLDADSKFIRLNRLGVWILILIFLIIFLSELWNLFF